jgi:murein DD-endopeptidase MepM/ murein hydrolase activator NlpD
MPDMKVSDPGKLTSISGNTSIAASRQAVEDRANRSTQRVTTSSQATTADLWLLPMANYQIVAPFGDTGALSKGVDLAAPEGTPFYAAHSGTVKFARWDGGYGYTVIIDIGNNTELVYGHASKLLVQEGQTVNSGDLLALTGATGYTFESAVHFEIRVKGAAVNPIEYLSAFGVDLSKQTDPMTLS